MQQDLRDIAEALVFVRTRDGREHLWAVAGEGVAASFRITDVQHQPPVATITISGQFRRKAGRDLAPPGLLELARQPEELNP